MKVWRVYHFNGAGWRGFGRDYLTAALAREVLGNFRAMFPDHRYRSRSVRVRVAHNPRTQA